MRYLIWLTSPHTGDRKDVLGEYYNRGHAIARLRGLRRAAWLAASEATYTMTKEA